MRAEYWLGHLMCIVAYVAAVQRAYRQIGNVRVYQPSEEHPWGTWPEAIKVVNTYGNAEGALGGESQLTPETGARSSSSARENASKRTFSWRGDDLVVTFDIAPPTTLGGTKLTPPLTWLAAPSKGAAAGRLKVLHESEYVVLDPQTASHSTSSSVQLSISRATVDNSLQLLRMSGFAKEDIYRTLDKGPWVLSYDLTKVLPRLIHDLVSDIGVSSAQAVHIISHCPYLLSQYARYRGRDIRSTVEALLEVGYRSDTFLDDCMRFPTMLAAPPDRIRGWRGLLVSFGIGTETITFGKLLRRAPFMFYIDPPSVHDIFQPSFGEQGARVATTTASGVYAHQALENLLSLRSLQLPDLDRVVRSQPYMLLDRPEELEQRMDFLLALFMEDVPLSRRRRGTSSGAVGAEVGAGAALGNDFQRGLTGDEEVGRASANSPVDGHAFSSDSETMDATKVARATALTAMRSFVQAYPNSLSTDVAQMRTVCNALRACGVRRSDVVFLVRCFPGVLAVSPLYIRELIVFLRETVGLRKTELVSFLLGNVGLFKTTKADLDRRMQYLRELKVDPQDVRDNPAVLTLDVPLLYARAEFLKALNVDPLVRGVHFLSSASPDEIANMVGVEKRIFLQFVDAFKGKLLDECDEDDWATKF